MPTVNEKYSDFQKGVRKGRLQHQNYKLASPYFLLSADLNSQGLKRGTKEFLLRSPSQKLSLQKSWLDHFGF